MVLFILFVFIATSSLSVLFARIECFRFDYDCETWAGMSVMSILLHLLLIQRNI